jgi:hypothetical protein
MAIEFPRPDIVSCPVVCHLHCKGKSNWVRLVNHSCQPCARFEVKIMSGSARMMLQASQDIYDGTEITVDYRTRPTPCFCESCVASMSTGVETASSCRASKRVCSGLGYSPEAS